jgi:hypothetical protein
MSAQLLTGSRGGLGPCCRIVEVSQLPAKPDTGCVCFSYSARCLVTEGCDPDTTWRTLGSTRVSRPGERFDSQIPFDALSDTLTPRLLDQYNKNDVARVKFCVIKKTSCERLAWCCRIFRRCTASIRVERQTLLGSRDITELVRTNRARRDGRVGAVLVSLWTSTMAPSTKKSAKATASPNQHDLRSFFGSTQSRGAAGSPQRVHAIICSLCMVVNAYRILPSRQLLRGK